MASRAAPGILAFNPAYRGTTGPSHILRTPRGFQAMQEILKSEAGFYATAAGTAYLVNKYGLKEDEVRDLINQILVDTDEGWISAPDLPEEKTLEEWKKENVEGFTKTPVDPKEGVLSTPSDEPPTFEDMTGGGFTKTPVDPKEGVLSTPVLKEEEKASTIMTIGKQKTEGTVMIGKREVPVEQTFVNDRGKRQILPKFNKNLQQKKEQIFHRGEYVDRDKLDLVTSPSGSMYYRLKIPKKPNYESVIKEYFKNNPDSYDAVVKRGSTLDGYPDKIKADLDKLIGEERTWVTYLNEIKKIYTREAVYPKSGLTLAEDYFQNNFRGHIKNITRGETNLSQAEMKRYFEEFRINIQERQLKPGETYTPKEINAAINLVVDTVFKHKPGMVSTSDKFADLDLQPYVKMRLENQEKTKELFAQGLSKPEAVQTAGHYGESAAHRIPGEGADMSMIVQQSLKLNARQLKLDEQHSIAREKGDIKAQKKIENKMKTEGIRSSYYDADGARIFIGADPEPGKFKEGGMVQFMRNGGSPHLASELLMASNEGEWSPSIDPSDRDWETDVSPYLELSPWMDIDELEFLFDVSNLSPDRIMEVLVQNGVPVEKAKVAVRQKVMTAKDGGIVQYFKEGTGEEGVTADQGSISGFDVKPYIPPGARFDEDPLTLGDIGTGVSEAAETMWPYMVPGVGEVLSHRDYRQFTGEAEQALEDKNYLKYAGMTLLGSVALGGTIPNWTVVGAVPNLALGIYKGVRKALTPKPKMIAPPIKMEKRFTVQDDAGNKFYQTKSMDDAEVAKLRVQDAEGKNMNIVETQVQVQPKKPKKTKQEIVPAFTVTADDAIGAGNNRLFYSKMDQYMQGTNGNLRVKTGASGNVADIPINEVRLSAKEWHDSFRAANIKESELVDSYIRQYLNKKGNFKEGKFTSNQKISYAEIKELMEGSPSRFVQTSKYSDVDGNLKFADSGRAGGYKEGTREEHVLWMDSKDIRGDIQELPPGISGYEAHQKMRKVETDVNFSANNKLEAEPYVIGWSLVDDRPGKLANGKSVTITTANEIQSDFLQKAASKKAQLKKDLRAAIQSGDKEAIQSVTSQIDNIFRPMPKTSSEIKGYISQIEQSSKVFDDVAKMDLNLVDDAVMKKLDDAAKVRDEAIDNLTSFIDDIDPSNLFPNIPFKDQKDWVSSLIKNDIAIAAKKRFYFDENGVLQINKNAPSHYTVSPSKVVKERWSVPDDRYGMHVPANMRTTEQHGKGVAYDLEYGGPNVTDASGKHFTSNAEETLKKIASDKNASLEIGKVKFGTKMEDSFLIELTPEMLTPYVQYFKHGGLVEAIPYNPLRSVLDVLGPIGAY